MMFERNKERSLMKGNHPGSDRYDNPSPQPPNADALTSLFKMNCQNCALFIT